MPGLKPVRETQTKDPYPGLPIAPREPRSAHAVRGQHHSIEVSAPRVSGPNGISLCWQKVRGTARSSRPAIEKIRELGIAGCRPFHPF